MFTAAFKVQTFYSFSSIEDSVQKAAYAPFYLSPLAAGALRSLPIAAGPAACDGRFVGEGKRLHPHVAF